MIRITRRLAVMNIALRDIEADFGPKHADIFRRDLHTDGVGRTLLCRRNSVTPNPN